MVMGSVMMKRVLAAVLLGFGLTAGAVMANVEDEISRAQGHGGTSGFFGLPIIPVEDLTATATADSGQTVPQTNGRFDKSYTGNPFNTGRAPAINGSRV